MIDLDALRADLEAHGIETDALGDCFVQAVIHTTPKQKHTLIRIYDNGRAFMDGVDAYPSGAENYRPSELTPAVFDALDIIRKHIT